MSSVLLVSPPWRMPDEGCLALATLRPILLDHAIATDTLHGTQLYPRTELDPVFLSNYAAHLYVPSVYPTAHRDEVIDSLLERFAADLNLEGLVRPGTPTLSEQGLNEAAVRGALNEELERAEISVHRCAEKAAEYPVVGFSVTFETQILAAVAIAKRLKTLDPSIRVVLGGAACFADPADALLASFAEVDAVCHCEGERVVAPLVEALLEEEALARVPGIAWRDPAGRIRHNPAPPLLNPLDGLPVPDYGDFVEALTASEWSDLPPKLYFEMSRGCWWGEKRLCSFCGLNADGLAFRRKSPERAVSEIATLYRRYPSARRLQATDNILDVSYVDSALPRLAALPRDPERPLRLFVEVKPNLKKSAVEALARAGFDLVQPGIESFSDEVLDLMKKGNTGLGQIQFIKWATEAGIRLVYNLLVRNPGEQAAWCREMTSLIDTIEHLQPPSCITPVWLERFSPYHQDPEAHGISDVRSKPYYRSLYRDVPVPLERLSYVFDYHHPMLDDDELYAATHELVIRVGRWQNSWRPGRLQYRDHGEHGIEILDGRGEGERVERLDGPDASLFRFLDRMRPARALSRLLPGEDVERRVQTLLDKRWVCADGKGRYLGVIPKTATP